MPVITMANQNAFSYVDFLQEESAGGLMSSQETQMSSQGFTALVNDDELFGGIKTEEDIDDIFVQPSTSTSMLNQGMNQIPVSPVSTASIESLGMEVVDESLKNAYEASTRKGSLMPLLKEELRCKIQRRRVDAGLEPDIPPKLNISSSPPPISEESKRRQELRKQRNREAAKRCRLKKHANEKKLKEAALRAEEENKRLRISVEQNRQSINLLLTALHQHQCVSLPPRISSPSL